MAKFSKSTPVRGRPYGGPIQANPTPNSVTFEGGAGYSRDPKSDLFLLAVVNMVDEDGFYQSAQTRDNRFVQLVHQVTKEDPGWVARFVPWLRNTANMRSAPVVMAVEYCRAGGPNGRKVIDSACVRADEPAEILGYYWATNKGRKTLASAVSRGVADAARRLYTERNVLRYDGQSRDVRMGDVVDMVHPTPSAPWQSDLFRHLLDRRHDHVEQIPRSLAMLEMDRQLLSAPEVNRRRILRDAELMSKAGWSWERLAGWLPGGMDAEAWETMIPTMGYMALLRNLRNFDEAKISTDTVKQVVETLRDPDAVAKSRQFPYRFLSAYKEAPGFHWAPALEEALDLSCANIPDFPGRTLVLVDVSASMGATPSARTKIRNFEIGALFGAALARKIRDRDPKGVNLVAFGTRSAEIQFSSAEPVLKIIGHVQNMFTSGRLDHGTEMWRAVDNHFNGHDRVVIFTDMQTRDSASKKKIPTIFGFNLAGYGRTAIAAGSPGRYELGGFTDVTFRLMPLLESTGKGDWRF